MSDRQKGLVESLSWKEIAGGIIAATTVVFFFLEYVINLRQPIVASLGSELTCRIEGAVLGAVTAFVSTKLYSQLRGTRGEKERKKKLPDKPITKDETKELKDRIREELQLLREEIAGNLDSRSFSGKHYSFEAFDVLQNKLIGKLEGRIWRQIRDTYGKIEALEFESNLKDVNERRYRETIDSVDKTLRLLRQP